VGATLGQAADALYLHEPLTQPLMTEAPGHQTNFDVDPQHPPRAYAAWAEAAFAGLPVFPLPRKKPLRVVRFPEQWRYGERARRRLVIKEINPFAGPWLLGRFRPRVIYIVRHPAAVALSNYRLGFLQGDDIWRRQGEHQGRAHRLMLDSLAQAQQHRIVSYEALCAAPVEEFRALFAFAGLAWDERAEARIAANSAGGDRSRPYSIERNSREMIEGWHGEIAPAALDELRAAFSEFELPWYQKADEWRADAAR
jgi:hypothetical protein